MKSQNIVLLTLEYPPQIGGIATYLAHLAGNFPDGTMHVLVPDVPGHHAADMRADVPIYRRTLTSRWLRPRWLPAAYWTWWLCRKERPSALVVSHLLNMGRVALGIRRLMGIPYVVILHGMDVALAASGGARSRLAAREILGGAAQVVANSKYTAGWAERLGVPKERITVVYPSPTFGGAGERGSGGAGDFRERHGLGKSFVLLSVGRLVPRKGFDVCLRAAAELIKEGRDVRHVIIGDGPCHSQLEGLAAGLGVGKRVEILGAVSDEELAAAYAACDAFALVPKSNGGDVEGFGIVYLDAGVFGKPAIGSRSGGVVEAVRHGETGLLVDSGDVNGLKRAIVRLMDDAALRESLGRGGRRRVEREYGDNRQARIFRAVIRRVEG